MSLFSYFVVYLILVPYFVVYLVFVLCCVPYFCTLLCTCWEQEKKCLRIRSFVLELSFKFRVWVGPFPGSGWMRIYRTHAATRPTLTAVCCCVFFGRDVFFSCFFFFFPGLAGSVRERHGPVDGGFPHLPGGIREPPAGAARRKRSARPD